MIDPEFPAGGGERSVKDRAWEPLPTSPALEKQAVEFEGLGWVKSSARRCTARSRQSGGTLPRAFLTPHQRAALMQQTFIEHLLCALPGERGNSETERGGGKEKAEQKRNKNEKTRRHRTGRKPGPKALSGGGGGHGCGRGGVPGQGGLLPLPMCPWVGAGGTPAWPAATASLEPWCVCKAGALAHYCNYAVLNLPEP